MTLWRGLMTAVKRLLVIAAALLALACDYDPKPGPLKQYVITRYDSNGNVVSVQRATGRYIDMSGRCVLVHWDWNTTTAIACGYVTVAEVAK